jgi:hypothetical protein
MNKSEMNELEMLKRRVKELELDAEQPTTRGHKRVIQIIAGKEIYFCRTPEEQMIFSENNPGVETETFNIELLNSTAEKYLNDPENKKQFMKKEEMPTTETPEELDWLHQAHRLGIPTDGRTKEDIVSEITASKQIPTTTSVR